MSSTEDLELMDDALDLLKPWLGTLNTEEVIAKEFVRERNLERLRALRDSGVTCPPCTHAVIFGSWGRPLHDGLRAATHCHRCHRSWRSLREAHCTVCCSHFASNEAASFHWDESGKGGPAKHTHPEECRRAGTKGPRYTTIDTEFGPTWQLTRYVEAQQ